MNMGNRGVLALHHKHTTPPATEYIPAQRRSMLERYRDKGYATRRRCGWMNCGIMDNRDMNCAQFQYSMSGIDSDDNDFN
jgi:hypothetical protein